MRWDRTRNKDKRILPQPSWKYMGLGGPGAFEPFRPRQPALHFNLFVQSLSDFLIAQRCIFLTSPLAQSWPPHKRTKKKQAWRGSSFRTPSANSKTPACVAMLALSEKKQLEIFASLHRQKNNEIFASLLPQKKAGRQTVATSQSKAPNQALFAGWAEMQWEGAVSAKARCLQNSLGYD